MLAQHFNIANQIIDRVVTQFTWRLGASGPALIKERDAEMLGIEKTAIRLGTAGAGSTMQENDGFSLWIATLFPVHRMEVINLQLAPVEGFNLGIEVFVGHRISGLGAEGDTNYGARGQSASV